ncbi:macrophage mannose receptor 1-like [Diadema antillarum]|uniref:macrophage mannose receptor 1-like n=1 Tax=Diadema antillarum TaxID=105358 RepID=UPI003A862714
MTYGLEENYCRNPSDAAAPWCYFHDPRNNRTDWGYCGVPECNPQDVGCYNALDDGASYRGAARTTASGHVCLEWKDTFYTPDRYPNSGLEENYCRNPTFFRYAPFCYYKGTSGIVAEYCDIPECEVEELCAGDDWMVGPTEEWCYKVDTNTQQTFEEAQEKCAAESASLTSITSESESTFLFGMVQDLNQLGFWIGATDIQQEAGWEWTDGSPFAYLHWGPGQPDNVHGTEACALMSGIDGKWTDEDCDLTFSHICKKRSDKPFTTMEPTTLAPGIRCPTDWSRYGSHCYLVQQDQTDWYTASRACEDLDSSLASVHSDEEMKHIVSKLEEAGREYYFFGANSITNQDQWVFGNGTGETPISYTNWADGQPDNFGADGEDCVAMLYSWNWQWNDADCESRYQVVCEDENNSGDMQLGRYTAHRESMTFAEAQDHCKKYDGTMATMLNDDDRDTMKELLNAFYDPFYPDIFWLGVNDIKSENSWVTGGDPDSKTPQTYTDWHAGEPNNYKTDGERCGMMAPQDDSDSDNEQFEWYDWGCGNAERYICENIDPESQYTGDNDRTFTVVNEALTWAEANADCQKRQGRLAQVLSSYDQRTINYMLYDNKEKLLTSKGAWLGLNDRMHQMTYEWVDGSEVTYTNWNSGEPDDFAEAQDCIFTYSQNGKESTGRKYYAGKWADYQCDDEDFGYVCKKTASAFGPSEIPPPEFDCPMGWFGSDTFCYLLLETQLSWEDAVAECKSYTDHGKSTNTTIAYIPNSEEEIAIMDALSGKNGLYWIGLHDPNREGTYHWEGGQPVTHTYWDTRQPGNDQHPCVAVSAGEDSNGRWDDQSCDSRYSAICQKPRRDDYVPEYPPTPSPDGSCAPGWVGYESYCYLIQREQNETNRLSFINALYDCFYRTSDWSSYLASLHSHREELFIQEQVQALTPEVNVEEEFWLGLTEYGGGYFQWYDGSELNYVNWGPGVPDDLEDGQYLAAVMYPANIDNGSEMYTTMPPVSPGKSERCEEGGNWQRWDYNADLDTCYLFMGSDSANRVTWFDALSRCSAEQSNMVSVHSKDENYFVQELVKTNGVTVMWLGMYDQETHGGFQWTDESPANYFKWDANEPGNSVTSCISMDSETGGWKLKDCGETMSFMCKKNLGGGSVTPAPTERAAGYCPKGWVTWGNKCLQVQDHLDSWTSARNHCMVLGGDLASIRDDKEEALAVSLLENIAGPVWLGLNDRDHEGLFTWSDGSPVFHTNWATNEPNNWGGVNPDGTPVAPTLSLCQSYYHYGNSCFKLHNGSYTRDEAEA